MSQKACKVIKTKDQLADHTDSSQQASIRLTFKNMPLATKEHEKHLLAGKWSSSRNRPFMLSDRMVDILWDHYNKDS